jgi:hypothetical protein
MCLPSDDSYTLAGTESDIIPSKLPCSIPNAHTSSIISSVAKAQVNAVFAAPNDEDTRCELDSHANMCVFGNDAFIFESAGKK